MVVGDGAGGKTEHQAIILRKVGVLIGVYGSTVTYQKHLCSSQHFSSSKNDLKCTDLYSSPSPDGPLVCHGEAPASYRLRPRHIALCYSIPGLSRSFRAVFLTRDELISMCTQTEKRARDLIRLSDHYNSAKKKKTESYLYLPK